MELRIAFAVPKPVGAPEPPGQSSVRLLLPLFSSCFIRFATLVHSPLQCTLFGRAALPKPRYTIYYNGNRIIRVGYEPSDPVVVAAGTTLDFTYEVSTTRWDPVSGDALGRTAPGGRVVEGCLTVFQGTVAA